MKLITLTIMLYLIIGCAGTGHKVINGPDGSNHELISCSYIEYCYEKAAEICGQYKIVNTSSETSGMNGNTSSYVNLLVKCN